MMSSVSALPAAAAAAGASLPPLLPLDTAPASPRASATASPADAPAGVDLLSSPLITGSRGAVPVSSPSMSKLPGLQFAIAHRRADLRLPSFALPYDAAAASSASSSAAATPSPAASPSSPPITSTSASMGVMSTNAPPTIAPPEDDDDDARDALRLSPTHCETPHFAAGVAPFCPEASPTDKAAPELLARRKKGTRRGTLNPEAKSVLKAWMFSPEHFAHPYPSEEEKEELASEAGIEVKQLSNWFTNARKRLWQPVLRQSGVEVKNFLSTGRGGPRGNKLDVPPNLQQLVPPSPPPSPLRARASSTASSTASSADGSPLKRAWTGELEAALPPPKRKKSAAPRKKSSASSRKDAPPPAAAAVAHQLSHELRRALADRSGGATGDATFQELEILAATSLIGLHQQQYQPVH